MAPTELEEAKTVLEAATETADDDLRGEIREVNDTFGRLTDDETRIDHAILDEQLNALRQLKRRANEETEPTLERAITHVESYRKEIDQA